MGSGLHHPAAGSCGPRALFARRPCMKAALHAVSSEGSIFYSHSYSHSYPCFYHYPYFYFYFYSLPPSGANAGSSHLGWNDTGVRHDRLVFSGVSLPITPTRIPPPLYAPPFRYVNAYIPIYSYRHMPPDHCSYSQPGMARHAHLPQRPPHAMRIRIHPS